MNTRLLFTLLLALSFTHSYCQKILTVDLDKIKARIENKNSGFYYPVLLQKFDEGDSTLTPEEYEAIYYGSTFQDNYNPYGMSMISEKFMNPYKAGRYKEALPFGLNELKDNPVNLKLTFKILICYHELGMTKEERIFARRYYSLLNVIYNSGNGSSIENAMVVISISDEYEILKDSQLQMTSQALIGTTDKLTLDQDSQTKIPKIEALFFNVDLPFGHMSKMFDKSEK